MDFTTVPSNDSTQIISVRSPGDNSSGGVTVEDRGVRTATLVFYLITFVFGVFGNSLVIYVVSKYEKIRSRSVSNYYIWNLAFADELFLLTIPFMVFASFNNDWVFGGWTCKIATVFYECNKFASVFTLMALSIDRFLATFHNLGRFREIRVGLGVCVLIWLLCLVLSTPYWLYCSAVTTSSARTSCKITWPHNQDLYYRKLFLYVNLVVGVAVPFVVIATCNTLMLIRIRRRTAVGVRSNSTDSGNVGKGFWKHRLLGTRSSSQHAQTAVVSLHQNNAAKINSSMSRVVVVIVVLFAVCQLPHHVMEYLTVDMLRKVTEGARPSQTVTQMFYYGNMVAKNLVFISSCCNPIIYGIFNRNYRNLYKQALCCSNEENTSRSVRTCEARRTSNTRSAIKEANIITNC